MRNFVITFKHDDKKIYQITDREFNSLKEMLETYEREKVDHSLPNIGRMVTEEEYLQLRQQQRQGHSLPNIVSEEEYLQLTQQQRQQQQQRDCPKCLIL